MKVIIAEKPSVARDIAKVLKITSARKGYIEGRGCAVTWAFGHLATLQEPSDYDPAWRRWSTESLPIIPETFKLKLSANRGVDEQFQTIKTLFEQADEIICATDAGREGELIFRYILALAGCEDKAIRRLWLSSLTPEAILAAFKDLRDGHEHDPLYAAARCRSESDWIVGLNATRLFTVRYGRIGGARERVLWSIGRVQTPVLAMIVERDDEIDQFRPQPFWELRTKYRDVEFKYRGKRSENQKRAEGLLAKVTGHELEIVGVAAKAKKEQPPQLYDLTTLQRDLNKQHGLSAADTLAAAQNLYEGKLITYPRTESRYIGKDLKPQVAEVLGKLGEMWPDLVAPLDLAKLPFTRRIVDDKKVTDHHAIIPTGQRPRNLGAHERQVYEAVTRQFIAAFHPVCLKDITTVDAVVNGVKFQAKGTRVVEPGWTALFPAKAKKQDDDEAQALPEFAEGEAGPHEPFLHEGKTKPPKYYSENSLLGAMEAAGKLVEDDALREALKERGIGTPATRAAIIETLLRRNYIKRVKKQLRATDMGRYLVALIRDPLLKSPELTGEWEEKLKQIERGELDDGEFMAGIREYVGAMVRRGVDGGVDQGRLGACPRCGQEVIRGKRAYGCSGWKEGCSFVVEPEYRGVALSEQQVRVLLQRRVLPYPVAVEGEMRMLVMSTQGVVVDVGVPSGEGQKRGKKG